MTKIKLIEPDPSVIKEYTGECQKGSVTIIIDERRCKNCDVCVQFCPNDVLELRDFKAKVKALEKCTKCMRCELLCPDFAIYVIDLDEEGKGE